MPRKSSRPQRRGSSREVDEETNPAAYHEYLPGWDGTIDPRVLSAPDIPTATPVDEDYALPPSLSHSHHPNYPSSNFHTEEDTQSYMTNSFNFINSTSASSEVGFDAVAGRNLEIIPDIGDFDASGIDQYRVNQLENFSTTSES